MTHYPDAKEETIVLVRVVADPDACIGSAECVAVDPDAVELDKSGTVHMLVTELDEARADELCDACPIGAITIIR